MTPVEPSALHEGAVLTVIGAGQPQYIPLPASVSADGTVMTEWELSAEDLAKVLAGGRVRLWVMCSRVLAGEFTPIMLEVTP